MSARVEFVLRNVNLAFEDGSPGQRPGLADKRLRPPRKAQGAEKFRYNAAVRTCGRAHKNAVVAHLKTSERTGA